MLNLRLVCMGKLKEAYWRQAVEEYEKRVSPFCRFQLLELPEERLPEDPSPSQIEAALRREGEAIKRQVRGTVCPLCIEGRQMDSQGLAGLLEESMLSPGEISFVIGSSFGLSPEIKSLGPGFSMSKMTFPHQLARVMLCEQIYRGFQILNHTKYHK